MLCLCRVKQSPISRNNPMTQVMGCLFDRDRRLQWCEQGTNTHSDQTYVLIFRVVYDVVCLCLGVV
jgi:hypothetical protein